MLAQLQATDLLESESGLPPYLQRSLLFPYSAGARFVDAIGTWGPANRALRGDGPVSTEQVLHPEKYRARERPLRVEAPRPPGAGWKKAASGTIGEFDTRELIRSSDSPARARRAPRRAGAAAATRCGETRDERRSTLAAGAGTRPATRRSSSPRCRATSSGRSTAVRAERGRREPTVRLTIGPAK